MLFAISGIGGKKSAEFKKLWNRSASSFSAQTVSLDLSKYAAVAIVFYPSISYQTRDTAWCEVGDSITMYTYFNYDDCYSCYRTVSVSATGVTFGTGKQRTNSSSVNASDNNNAAIPVEIWGIPQGG